MQVVPLQQEIQAEEHYTNARQAFERNDWATAEQLCATALAIFPTHTASLELQGNARNAGAADRAIQSGRGLMGSRQFVEAGQALAEAARLLEPIRAKQHMLADCYFDMGVCDVLGPVAPAPNAEALYSKAIEKEGKREIYYRARAWARMCSGNLGAAEADLKAAAKIGQPRAKGDASDSVCLASIDTTVRDENLLRQMAGAQQQQVVTVTVFLNERWIPLRGWSSGHLLPTDRDMFSLDNGDGNFAGERHGTPSEAAIVLPTGWQWAGPWGSSVGDPAFDKEGFQYAFNWTSSTYGAKNNTTDCVRRRRLMRAAQKVLPAPGAAPQAGGPLGQTPTIPSKLPTTSSSGDVLDFSRAHPTLRYSGGVLSKVDPPGTEKSWVTAISGAVMTAASGTQFIEVKIEGNNEMMLGVCQTHFDPVQGFPVDPSARGASLGAAYSRLGWGWYPVNGATCESTAAGTSSAAQLSLTRLIAAEQTTTSRGARRDLMATRRSAALLPAPCCASSSTARRGP